MSKKGIGLLLILALVLTAVAAYGDHALSKNATGQALLRYLQMRQTHQPAKVDANLGTFTKFGSRRGVESSLSGTGAITGRLSGLDSLAWSSAWVEAVSTDSVGADGTVNKGISWVKDDGSYRIEGLATGSYYVFAWADGYVLKYYNNVLDQTQATKVVVTEGQVTEGIDFKMERIVTGAGSIAGRVVREKDQQPIPFAGVSVFSPDDPAIYGWAETDRNGYYRITGLKSGSYYVQIWAEGYLFEYYDNAKTLDAAKLVEVVEPNETAGIDVALAIGGVIAGKVTDQNGNPQFGVYLEAVTAFRDSTIIDSTGVIGWPISYIGVGKAVTDENGLYKITGLPSDTFYVHAFTWNGWYSTEEWYDNVATLQEAKPIVLNAGEEALGIDFQLSLEKPTGVIAGQVTDLQDHPIPNAYVQAQSLMDASGRIPVWISVVTDENGDYRFDGLPNGSYYVYVWAQSGWQYVQRWWPDSETQEGAQPVVIADNSNPGPIDFRLPLTIGAASISGLVKYNDGRPLPGVSIQVTPTEAIDPSNRIIGTLWAWGYTDSTGFYQVDRLPAGSYTVYASFWENTSFGQQWYDHADSLADADAVVLADGEKQADINFDLTLKPMYGSIAGTVIDSVTGLPISRAYVEVSSKYNDLYMSFRPFRFWNYYAITDDNGKFQLDWLWEGEYLVSVYANGSFEYYDNAVVAEQATPVKVVGGTVEEVNFALLPRNEGTGVISGKVVSDYEGVQMEIAVITAKPAVTILIWPQSEMFFTAVTNKEGAYEMKGLPPGEYYVQSFAPWHIGEFYDNTYDPTQATLVKVDGINPTTGIDFSLAPAYYLWDKGAGGEFRNGAVIVGKVLDANGQPLADANVYLLNSAGQAVSFVRTKADGTYEMAGMPPGSYVLQAGKIGYASQYNGNAGDFSQAVPVQVGNGSAEVNFSLSPQTPTGVGDQGDAKIPKTVELYGNYPNPFNPETRISFALPKEMQVTLRIYNLFGEEVAQLYDGKMTAGTHSLIWNGRNQSGQPVTSGLYLYRLESEQATLTGKMILMR